MIDNANCSELFGVQIICGSYLMESLAVRLTFILSGLLVIVIGAYFWRLAEKTPKGKLIPRLWGVPWTSEGIQITAVLFWFLGEVLIIFGIIE